MPNTRDIAQKYPSVLWSETDWLVALRLDNQLYFNILAGIGKEVAKHNERNTTLTPLQEELVNLARLGLTSEQMAKKLFLSRDVVKSHLHRARRKKGVRTTVDLYPFVKERDV